MLGFGYQKLAVTVGVLGNGKATLMGLNRKEVCDFGMIEEMLRMKLKAMMVLWEMDMILSMILSTPSPTKSSTDRKCVKEITHQQLCKNVKQ